MKFYTNESRLKYLEGLVCRDRAAFEKQAWEWLTTGVFGLTEFREVLRMGTP